MAGYNTKDLQRNASKTYATNESTENFKAAEGDRQSFIAKINCTTANGATANLETSFDGGTTWDATTATVALADATVGEISYFPTTDMLGPLARIKFTGGGPVVAAIWITRVS